jgi:uncharacterized protein YidB (DUF937 family)
MSRSTPSLLALLGLIAVAGYQNRDRISEMLSDAGQKSAAEGTDPASAGGGFVAEIGQFFQGRSVSTALGDLIERFKAAGQGDAAESWVSDKANMPLGVDRLEAALGQETLAELAQKTGLSQAEVLLRLNVALPDVVNSFTPNGRLPTEGEWQARG